MKEGDNKLITEYQNNLPTDIMPGEFFRQINTLHVPHVKDYYMISTHGRIWTKLYNKYLQPAYDNKDGYAYVRLATYKDTYVTVRIHRLMLIVFDPIMGFQNLVCNHMDGNKQNNYMGNLEWTTVAGNTQHAYEHGLEKRGEDHSAAKISNETAMKIISLLPKVGQPSPYYSCRQIAEVVGNGCNEKMVLDIYRKISWKHMTKDIIFIPFEKDPNFKKPAKVFTDEQESKLAEYFTNVPKGDISMMEHARNALKSIGIVPNDRYIDSARKYYLKFL